MFFYTYCFVLLWFERSLCVAISITSLLDCWLIICIPFMTLFCTIIIEHEYDWRDLKSIGVGSRNCRYRVWLASSLGAEYVMNCHWPNIVVVWFECPRDPILGPFFLGIANKVENSLKIWAHKLHRGEIYADVNSNILSLSSFCNFLPSMEKIHTCKILTSMIWYEST